MTVIEFFITDIHKTPVIKVYMILWLFIIYPDFKTISVLKVRGLRTDTSMFNTSESHLLTTCYRKCHATYKVIVIIANSPLNNCGICTCICILSNDNKIWTF